MGMRGAKELVDNAPMVIPTKQPMQRHDAEVLMNELRRLGAKAQIT